MHQQQSEIRTACRYSQSEIRAFRKCLMHQKVTLVTFGFDRSPLKSRDRALYFGEPSGRRVLNFGNKLGILTQFLGF